MVLLCTSGTAAANYYPAICEANISHVPLVVLTTDRPHELRQVGAPQAMDQLQMYQNHVKLFVEMALPEATEEMLNYAYWQGAKGAAFAQQTPAAPVHLNFPLREPLLPDLEKNKEFSTNGFIRWSINPFYRTSATASGSMVSEKRRFGCRWQSYRGRSGVIYSISRSFEMAFTSGSFSKHCDTWSK